MAADRLVAVRPVVRARAGGPAGGLLTEAVGTAADGIGVSIGLVRVASRAFDAHRDGDLAPDFGGQRLGQSRSQSGLEHRLRIVVRCREHDRVGHHR
jgi:hypothetical protein